MTAPERPAFVPGELVEIAIGKASVAGPSPLGERWVRVTTREAEYDFPLHADGVKVRRLAPPEWPPIAGDLWRDHGGTLWFAYRYESGVTSRTTELRLTPNTTQGGVGSWRPDRLLAERGPVQLVHREPQPEPSEDDL